MQEQWLGSADMGGGICACLVWLEIEEGRGWLLRWWGFLSFLFLSSIGSGQVYVVYGSGINAVSPWVFA